MGCEPVIGKLIDMAWKAADAVVEARTARRRRIPVSLRCSATDANGRRCALDAGHAEQHRTNRP